MTAACSLANKWVQGAKRDDTEIRQPVLGRVALCSSQNTPSPSAQLEQAMLIDFAQNKRNVTERRGSGRPDSRVWQP